ncbi:focadhesin-like isoform X2 [Mizuhopecten yessoensis]|uniref:Focadhesin n=2 Tax=Mizuhopecten yessoensis TaxID=6573 RepID=A0A210PEJ5_MIZYE|nr:focadhesin-like isoform X2 [Mizuhopecten yessoensis]XP_021343660.1 focadhesin-like isoform X2 [Mizuhopecten yessoensis]OWF34881.1 Focadhesin [Mizuhopecten yessoensis]
MEDVKKRLAFGNPAVQTQAVWRLYTEITKKASTLGRIDSKTPECVEIKLLWEYCGDEVTVISRSACQVLVRLVTDGNADFLFILNGLLNQVPSARSLLGIVSGIRELLVLQIALVENQDQLYSCPYRLRTPPHPFITILTNRPEAWPLLQHQVYSLCCHGNKSVRQNAMEMLAPFLKFVLVEPQQSSQYQPMKTSLERVLMQVIGQSQDQESARGILRFLTNILPYFQIRESQDLAKTTQFVTEIILQCLSYCRADKCQRELRALAEFGLSLHHQGVLKGQGVTSLMDALMKVASSSPEVMASDQNLITVATTLLSCSVDQVLSLLKMCKLILETDSRVISPVGAGMLVLPVLQILATPKSELIGRQLSVLHSLAGEIILNIEKKRKIPYEMVSDQDIKIGLTTASYQGQNFANWTKVFSMQQEQAVSWMSGLMSSLKVTNHIPFSLTNLVSALLTMFRNDREASLALKTLTLIANRDNTQAPWFLPLMLYQLGSESTPSVRFDILMTIPKLATHKVCVGPILKTIQSFGTFPAMKGTYLQMLTDLWKIQDRCFPQLLKEIMESPKGYSLEVLLVKAKAIRDVCKLRPEQHGTDMLGPLSDILTLCPGEEEAAVSSLALEGLYFLCEAEVINILSAWSVLADSLVRDSRPAVVEKICELFSLVPSLEEQTADYEKFCEDAVMNLWLYTNSDDTKVCGAAFQALAMYRADQFKVSHLPRHITEDLRQQAEHLSNEEEREVSVDELFPQVPALCYTRLLKTLPKEVLPDYEAFLAAMLAKEVADLPRGIYHSSLWRQSAATNQSKAIGSIPAFITGHYYKTKQPGLRPGLAVSTLFCYDPPLEVGRDGRPRKHYIITHGKNFQQMFKTLLQEVPIQPSEWHRSMVIPQAWTSFVDRLFTAMVEGRRAEIELQLKRDHVSEDEARLKKQVAWLWVRDTLVDVIKISSRGNPTMQSNSIYALAGLAVTVNRHGNGLDTEAAKAAEDSSEFMSPPHWLTVVIDTIISLMDVTFTPKGKLIGLCQQLSVDNRLPASLLAQASASVALSQVVPALITLDVDRIFMIINFLLSWLPGQPGVPESPVLQFHGGLGLGMFLSRLLEEHFADISGTKGMLQIWKSFDKLEECCLAPNVKNRSGAILGLGMAVCAMCEEGKTESRAHVVSIYDKLLTLCDELDPLDNIFQAVSVCVACIAGAAFSSNILLVTRVDTAVDKLMTTHSNHPQVTGVSLALGMLCYSLSRAGHPGIGDVRVRLFGTWMKAVSSEGTAPMEKVAILNGLMALIGSERTLIPVQSGSVSSSDLNADDVIKVASQIVTSGNDLGIQNNAAWMLGHLYLSACAVADTRASVPSTYGYLPEKSFLRAIVDFVSEAGKAGAETVPKEQVEVALTSLQEEVEQALPPVNWAGVLTPMMRMGFGDKVRRLSVKLAVKQSGSAPTAAMFLTTWMTLPLLSTLDEGCQIVLYDALPKLICSIAPTAIGSLLGVGSSEPYIGQDGDTSPALVHVLAGLTNALKVNDPPEAVTAVLYKAVATFYSKLSSCTQVPVLCLVADCLGNLPDDLFDKITGEDFLYDASHSKGCLVRCYLVVQGKQPITILNSCIDATFNNKRCNHSLISTYLQHCFYQVTQSRSEFTGVIPKLHWLVELLGHVRNIATGATTLSDDITDKTQVMDLAVDIIAAVLCLWMSTSSACVLSVTTQLLTCPDISSSNTQDPKLPWKPSVSPRQVLPAYITGIQSEPWDQVLPKVVDCWTTLLSRPDDIISRKTKSSLQDSLQILRHSTTFRKPTVWTEIYDTVQVK